MPLLFERYEAPRQGLAVIKKVLVVRGVVSTEIAGG